jgi:hypothetical protein
MTADSDRETDVPIVCPECGTETRIPISDVASTLEAHNANRHDGEDIAQVDPALAAELADLVAEDMDLV